MAKRAFIIHGWAGYPEEGWFPWLERELEQRGFLAAVPQMPDPAEPKIESWVSELARIVGKPDKETYFVGHSIGCQTILRYLETLPPGTTIGGAVFVAGWLTLKNLEGPEMDAIAKPWLETPIDFKKVNEVLKKSVAIFSDDDPWVPLTDAKLFEKNLGSATIIERQKSHFQGESGIKELPSALAALLQLSKTKTVSF